MPIRVIALLVLGVPLLGLAQDQAAKPSKTPSSCDSGRKVTGACFKVRGRLNYWNGTPSTRIWIVGTHRMLSVPSEDSQLPDNVAEHFSRFDDEVWGDFEVCPLEEYRTGEMQMVCVAKASNLRFTKRKPTKPKVGQTTKIKHHPLITYDNVWSAD